MTRAIDTQAPKAWVRIREALTREAAGLSPSLGEVVRVLAAARPGGVFLSLGEGAGETGAWILDGMDLASRLVTVVEDADEAELLAGIFGDDLRVTVHVQEPPAFLDDVRDHRFDLITAFGADPGAALTRLALARLARGGFHMTRHSIQALGELLAAPVAATDVSQAERQAGGFALARLPGELAVTLIAHRPQRPPTKRRGGRRAREGVTPLFSSRPRGGGA